MMGPNAKSILGHPTMGVYVPSMVWTPEYRHSTGSTLIIFVSNRYDPEDNTRSYDKLLVLAGHGDLGCCARCGKPTQPNISVGQSGSALRNARP